MIFDLPVRNHLGDVPNGRQDAPFFAQGSTTVHIIIDGYNLIRQSDTLRRIDKRSLEEGRTELIGRLAAYRKSRGHTITVVFDGWAGGGAHEERLRENGVTVVYSRRGETADEVIKRMARTEKGKELVVISSDREVAQATERAGGVAIPSPEFEGRMDTAWLPLVEESPGEDDNWYPESGTRKKGSARKLSKRERRIRRILYKL